MGSILGMIVQYRKPLIAIAAAFALITIGVFGYVKNQKPGQTGPGYGDVFSDEEKLAAERKVAEERAIMAEVGTDGRPTERAKLKVLESLRAR